MAIEDLLLELVSTINLNNFQGIDYKSTQRHQADWLPLEPFDDTEYDCRLPEEWIEYGNDPITGRFTPIPGKGLWKDEDGSGYWRSVLIHGYDKERNVFTGMWDDDS